ncbi:MAG TPA: DMT family transporter [Bryobacteraceae bacterium]|jgi:drug/metabolite transporter (DMT)-like permease|nr:DMT family transporter [Bryobacteraceae bacterium]
MRHRAELALIGVTIIWGTTFVVVKSALADVSAFVFLTLRFVLAAALLGLIYRKAVRRASIGPGLLAGGLLFTAYVFQTLGLEYTTPSKSAFLTGLSIPMVPLASSCVYRVKPRLVEVAGILIATIGMALMTVSASVSLQSGINRGDLLSFLCAVTFALHIVVIGHYSPIIGHESLSVIQIAVAAMAGLAVFRLAEPVHFRLTPVVAGALLLTGPFATALAFTTQAWAQKYTSATRAALIFALEPVVAWTTSWVLTGETLPNRGKVGAGAILAGILLVEMTRSERGLETSGSGSETKAAGVTS